MNPQNPLTPNNKSDNDVLNDILNEKGHYYGEYGATSGESLVQRYIASLAAREPITIALTVVPVVVLLFASFAFGGGEKSRTTEDTDSVGSSSETLDQAETTSLTSLSEAGSPNNESSSSRPASSTAETSAANTTPISSITPAETVTNNASTQNNNGGNRTTAPESGGSAPVTSNPPITTISPIDLCSNIDGNQLTLPANHVRNATGKCSLDLCTNIDGNQATVPKNYVRNSAGKCHKDLCLNIDGNQAAVPAGYTRNSASKCNLKLGTLCNIADSGLNESSGLVASIKHPGIVYTHNDEKGPILAVSTSTCAVVARITVAGLRGDPDPEGITIDRTTGKIWFGDIGNGHPGQPSSMTDKKRELKYPNLPARIVAFSEPAKLSGNITISNGQKVDITYQGGMQNSESLLVNPKTGQGYIINKQATSTVYRLPKPLKSGEAKNTGVKIPGWATDATFTNNGKWIFVRYRTPTDPAPTKVLVYDANWKYSGTVSVPKVGQGESITMEPNGVSFIIGSEGKNSPLVRVALPNKYK